MRTAILVLGMHRSGTSALTWLLGQAGAALPIDPLPPQADNPLGFWESAGLVAENNRLLRRLHSTWYDPRSLAWGRMDAASLDESKARLRAAIDRSWPSEELFAIKDPRLCRLVPIYAGLLADMGIACRAVLALRSPESVAASLASREDMGLDYGRLLWLRHMMEAERATRDMPRVTLSYDAVLEDWRSAIPGLSAIMGQTWDPDAAQQAEVDAFLNRDMRHHAERDSPPKGALSNTVERVWRGLQALAVRDEADERRELNRAYDRFEEKTWLEGDVMLVELRHQRGRVKQADVAEPPVHGRLRVHIFAWHRSLGPQSSAYIRLLQPLSDAMVSDRVEVSIGPWNGVVSACDLCIVQRAALPDPDAATQLIAVLRERGTALVVDLDDAFVFMSDEQLQRGGYQPRRAALDALLPVADETWFSSDTLAAAYPGGGDRAVIIPNAIDPRLWRDWRTAGSPPSNPVRRFLYMGTGTHADDFAVIRPHLEDLAQERPDQFDVTLIGVLSETAPAPWLTHIKPPAEATPYPEFVAWLRRQGRFDIGLAPLADTPFNHAKSDIKLLDYSALGLRSLVSDSPAYRADAAFRSAIVTDWPTALREAIDDPVAARVQADIAAAHTWLNRTVPSVAVRLLDRLERLVASKPARDVDIRAA